MTFTKKVLSLRKDFDMSSTSSCVFHHSQWEPCIEGEEHASVPYLMYRMFFMLILISSLIFSTLCQSHLYQIFLTNWSFTIQTLYGTLFCLNILWAKRDFLSHKILLKLHYFQGSYRETSNVKPLELKEANSWGDGIDTNKRNSNTCVNIDLTDEVNEQKTSCIEIDKHEELSQSPAAGLAPNGKQEEDKNGVNVNNNNIRENAYPKPSNLEKIIWVLMNVSHVLPHIVALGYWLFVYKYDPKQPACQRFRSHFIVHGATSVLALIDTFVVAVPVRKTHFIFPSIVLFIYGLFSYIYEISGGPYRDGKEFIYSVLNWRYKPSRTAAIVIVGVIISPLVHLTLCWGLHHIRLKLHSWRKNKRNEK